MAEVVAKKKRIFYYDFLRCFAIIAIIATHAFAGIVIKTSIFGTKFWYYSMFLNSLRDIGVPLFIVISGALLLNRKETLVKFVKKRVSRVIIPYVFWMIVFIFFVYICAHLGIHYSTDLTLTKLFFSTFALKPERPSIIYWFVPMMITVYVVIFIINKINEKYPSILKIALVLSVITVVLLNLGILPQTKPLNYPFYAAFAVIGYYLANFDFTVKSIRINENKLTIIFLLLSLGLYIIQVLLIAHTSIALNKHSPFSQFTYLNVCLVCCVFLFARYFSQSTSIIRSIYDWIEESKLGEAITSISVSSYGMYLCHMIFIVLLQFFLTSFKKMFGIPIYVNVLFVLTIILSWALVFGLSKVPYLNKVAGSG